jgi:hypothetical protein
MKFSELFQKRKDELKLSLEDIASRLASSGYSVSKSGVGLWATGDRTPRLGQKKVRGAIASALELDPNEMMNLLGYIVSKDERSSEARMASRIIDELPDADRRRIAAMIQAYNKVATSDNQAKKEGNRSRAGDDIQIYSIDDAERQLEVILDRFSDDQIKTMLSMAYNLGDMIARNNFFTEGVEWDIYFAWSNPIDLVRQKLVEECDNRGIEIGNIKKD